MELESSDLHLYHHQVPHLHRELEILHKHKFAIDGSGLGTGKSYTTAAIGLRLGLSFVVICPVSAMSVWKELQKAYNLNIVDMVSYQSLRGVKGRPLKNRLLTREGSTFTPTPHYLELVREGVLLVIDEAHMIKNDCEQHHACRALTSAILASNSSYFILLSATILDQEECIMNVLRLAGYITQQRLAQYGGHTVTLLGAQELIDSSRLLDPSITEEIVSQHDLTSKTVHTLCFKLFIHVIRDRVVSEMVRPTPSMQDIRNGYYNMLPDQAKELEQAIQDLSRVARYNPNIHTTDPGSAVGWGLVKKILIKIDELMLPILERLIRMYLQEPKRKVIVYVNYNHACLFPLADHLKDLNPLLLYGKVKGDERGRIVQMFQTGEPRLLLCNLRVGSSSISLDDQVGDSPRTTLILPSHSILDLQQATGRTDRSKTKSASIVRFVYGKCGKRLTSILSALARKSAVLSQLHAGQFHAGIRFPGQYEDEIEAD